jgi:glutamate-1-semialdehyde 2,1-aminomutase
MRGWQERAITSIAGEVTHDNWHHKPHPLVFSYAQGAYKWDMDGNRYTDFWMGHGSLLLGHNHEAVSSAIIYQATRGTHLSGNHSLLIEWAEKIIELIPSVERVRFCASGTEATLLALRLARAYTNRKYIVRIDGHFHGWHDEALSAIAPNWPNGSHPDADKYLRIGDPDDVYSVHDLLKDNQVAAVILEPGGGSSGTLPYSKEYLQILRELTQETQTLLIFDEVMSGFRYAPGGVQELSGIEPDITTVSKILCGGLPGAAVGGRHSIFSLFGDKTKSNRVIHTGTFNGNPLSAAAGLTTLNLIADGIIQRELTERTSYFVRMANETATRQGLDIRLFHQASIFHIVIGAVSNEIPIGPSRQAMILTKEFAPLYEILREKMLSVGLDMHTSHGWFSSAHTKAVIDETLDKLTFVFSELNKSQFSNLVSETCTT